MGQPHVASRYPVRRRLRGHLRDFLNAGLDPETTAPEPLRQVRNLTTATLGFTILAVPMIFVNAIWVGPAFGLALGLTVLGALANVAWIRRSQRIALAGHLTAALLFSYLVFSLAHAGGMEEPNFAWIYLVPLAVALLMNARAAALWSAACVLATMGFWLAARNDWLPANRLAGDDDHTYLLFSHVLAILGVTILAGTFARNHQRLQRWLREANAELRQEGRYVRTLHQAAVLAHEAGTVEEALTRSVELVCAGTGWDVANVWLPRENDPKVLEALPGGYERDPERDGPFRRTVSAQAVAAGDSFVGLVLSGRAPVWCGDVTRDARFAHCEAAREADLHGALAFPLVMGREVTAVLEFFSREPRMPERRLLRLLSHVGTQVSRVLERCRAEARIQSLAYYDTLTGLPNRQLFQERLDDALEQAHATGAQAALLFVDLDGFKRVNDTLGHQVGDGLLREVTRRFARSVRLTDVIGRKELGGQAISRLGGDEFTVLLGKVAGRTGAATVAERLLASLATPIEIGGHEIFAGASIGIAMFPEDGEDPETLLRNADAAMYVAKNRGRGQFQFHADEGTRSGSRRLQIEGPLRRALQNDQFRLHYQPLLDMRGGQTIGAEALLRWHEPELGNVSPAEFIPLAEQCGLINTIGAWIIHAACAQIRAWIEDGYAPVRVAVNLSGQQIRGPALVECVAGALRENELRPELLELEITESTIMRDDDVTSSTLRALSELGVGIVLDDFGTGYSSLTHLRRHPIDSLKLDRSFVSGLPDSPDDVAIATAVIAMAHGLRAHVTAEGIETPAQLEFLREHGCDVAQGFLFSQAVPGAEFVRFLEREKPAS
jgi:diguanylate cyclase (GGDEF)-like protein